MRGKSGDMAVINLVGNHGRPRRQSGTLIIARCVLRRSIRRSDALLQSEARLNSVRVRCSILTQSQPSSLSPASPPGLVAKLNLADAGPVTASQRVARIPALRVLSIST